MSYTVHIYLFCITVDFYHLEVAYKILEVNIMEKLRLKIAVFLAVITLLYVPVHASEDTNLQNDCAKALVELKIMQGYEDGSLRLENKIKRSEFVTLIIKMLGYDEDTDISNVNVSFTDIKKSHWAYKYAVLSAKYNLIIGTPDKKFQADNYITYAEALTILIRSLGYEKTLEGKWPQNVINKSEEIELSKNLDINKDKQITRGEMSVMVYNSLTVNFN